MMHHKRLYCLFFLLFCACSSYAQATIYVSKHGDNSDGQSWSTSYTTIEMALQAAKNSPEDDQIWVECGDYKIEQPLQLLQGVSLYGGMRRTDNPDTRSEINLTNITVIRQQTKGCAVVEAVGLTNALLDGFTITGANGAGAIVVERCGAGVKFVNCLVDGNVATTNGVGVRLIASHIYMFNCKISNNKLIGSNYGAGVYIDPASSVRMDYCIICGNATEGDYAGGVYAVASPTQPQTIFYRCSIQGNMSAKGASGIYASGHILFDGTDICSNIVRSDKAGKGAIFFGDQTQISLDNGAIITGNAYGIKVLSAVEGVDGSELCRTFNGAHIETSYSSNTSSDSFLAPDLKTVQQDIFLPDMEESLPAPGKRVKVQLPRYVGTNIYHCLYLPTDWVEGRSYPVIVDYPGNGPYHNRYGDVSEGFPESNPMGYGISAGKGAICLGLGYIDERNGCIAQWWWGDVEKSIDYCIEALEGVCKQYGGDINNVILTGFSRSAIGAGFIHRHNDRIAEIWKGYITYDGFDTDASKLKHGYGYPSTSYNFDPTDNASRGYQERFARISGKPYIVFGTGRSVQVDSLCSAYGYRMEFCPKRHRNHNATWVLRPTYERKLAREWFVRTLESPKLKMRE